MSNKQKGLSLLATLKQDSFIKSYWDSFKGIANLYGIDNLFKFSQSTVLVIGAGGVGSWAVEALARTGIGRIIMIDPDDLCYTNINRQLPAMLDTVGEMKTEVLAQRIKNINPCCQVVKYEEYLTTDNMSKLITFPEQFINTINTSMLSEQGKQELTQFLNCQQTLYIIDAIDNGLVKTHLVNFARRNKHKLVVCGGAGGKFDVSKIKIADMTEVTQDSLISNVRNYLRRDFGYKERFKDKKFKLPTVYSTEQMKLPAGAQSCELKALNCQNGYGSSTVVTATFANFAVAQILKMITNAGEC